MSDVTYFEICNDCGRPQEKVGGSKIWADKNTWIALDRCDCGAPSGTWIPKEPGLKP